MWYKIKITKKNNIKNFVPRLRRNNSEQDKFYNLNRSIPYILHDLARGIVEQGSTAGKRIFRDARATTVTFPVRVSVTYAYLGTPWWNYPWLSPLRGRVSTGPCSPLSSDPPLDPSLPRENPFSPLAAAPVGAQNRTYVVNAGQTVGKVT